MLQRWCPLAWIEDRILVLVNYLVRYGRGAVRVECQCVYAGTQSTDAGPRVLCFDPRECCPKLCPGDGGQQAVFTALCYAFISCSLI